MLALHDDVIAGLTRNLIIVLVILPGHNSQPTNPITLGDGETANNVNFTVKGGSVIPDGLTGVGEMFMSDLKVYPNPTTGVLTLHFVTDSEYLVTVRDVTGKTLLRKTHSDQIMQINISDYPAGIYLLTIDNGKQKSTTRIVKN